MRQVSVHAADTSTGIAIRINAEPDAPAGWRDLEETGTDAAAATIGASAWR